VNRRSLRSRWLFACLVLVCLAWSGAAQEPGGEAPAFSILPYLFGSGFIFQLIAIVHCAKQGRDRYWIWILLIGGLLGVAAYVIIEVLPEWTQMKRKFTAPARRKRIAMLRAMIRDNPSAGNYEQLGELLVQQRKWSEARDAFDRAIASRADSLDPFYWRGVSAFELDDDDAAVRDLQYVVDREPKYDYSKARCLLGRALARSGRTAEAAMSFDRLVESTTASESLVAAAEFYAANRRADRARELVESILARRETMPAYQKRRDRAAFRAARKLRRKLRATSAAAAGRTVST
jgi:hypothetical protein